MRIHYLQHAPFEAPGNIENWAKERGHHFAGSKLYDGDALPSTADFDWLVVMGGPMGVADGAQYPWLAREKALIRVAIDEGKIVLGVCLGAQLICDVLGGKVSRNPHKEIGWFPVTLLDAAREFAPFRDMPQTFTPFHWHGDTFSIVDGAVPIASSEGCVNQGFVYRNRVVGLQFHLETTEAGIEALIENGSDDLSPGAYVQKPTDMLVQTENLRAAREILLAMLDGMAAQKNYRLWG